MKKNRVHKQAFWFTLINYLGVAIGVVSTLFVYPYDKEFLGLVRYVDSIAQMFFPFMVFGGAQALIHFYPSLSDDNKKQLFKYSIFTILAVSLLILIFLILVNSFVDWKNYHYLFYAFPIGIAIAFTELFKRQATNIERLEMPTFYEKIIPKIALPLIFGLLIFGYLNSINALLAFIGAYIIMFVLIIVYVLKHFKLNSGFNFKSLFKEVPKNEYYKYSFYSFLGSFGAFLAFRIDAFMIPEFLSFEANGTFNIGVALATSLAIPATGMFAIYGPKISSLIKNDDFEELGKKYIDIAKLLFFIGAVLYTSIVLGIDSLFQLLPKYDQLVDSIPIIFLLGANVLFNMSTGFNSEIISYSKYYRFNIVSILILAVLNIALNLYFLINTNLGIIGVAYASLISMVTFNCLKLIFIYQKFGILPFDRDYFKLIITVGLVFFVFYLMPDNDNNILNLFLKAGLCSVVILIIIYKMKWVYSFNYWIEKLFKLGKQ
ncbi:polysaccharide biosynthesis C-terminal domain-containing protein [Flavobacteriaceae bacterium XHP0103]|uniref:lipopolysaccharide biosynthesis protein n=1 Tax=Marixanthotalea marina TaxID=2844359 RepID=UPI002989B871|nr:polysaccharide biosynthesis C-terminal domain-containing protein [Marixanthotalea marina]MBU3821194.1 polysaccharide biosynthesis C-terminal domain-containing protein [Marixanthotalea marina]